MEFKELTDEQWELIEPSFPPQHSTGRKRVDDRKVINGILFVLVTGCRWGDMPRCYGSPITAWRQLKTWPQEGIWDNIIQALCDTAYSNCNLSLDTKSEQPIRKIGFSI